MTPLTLRNNGNTCWWNSLQQCLYSCDIITKDTKFAIPFNKKRQECAHEALYKIIDTYNLEHLFEMITLYTLKCGECGFTRTQKSKNIDINIMPNNTIEDYNMSENEICKGVMCEKQNKHTCHIKFNEVTKTNKFMVWTSQMFALNTRWSMKPCEAYEIHGENEDTKIYNLVGCILHFGGNRGGHYIAIIYDKTDDCWYYCNDSNVKKIDDNQFNQYMISKNLYMCFYKAI